MSGGILTRCYPQPKVNVREVLGYMGCREATAQTLALVEDCLPLAEGAFDFRVCYREFPLNIQGEILDMGFARTESRTLRTHLMGCASVVVFGATVGLEIDRLVARYGRLSPAKGLCLQALGAERIEALCDLFCHEMAEREKALGHMTSPRFSPGYGDLPLELQRDIFSALDLPRRIGLSLNDSLLMSPSKSVTAMVGIKETKEETV